MTDTAKRLFGPAQLSGSAADTYTVPALTTAIVKELIVANTSSSDVSFSASVGADADGTRIVPTVEIAAHSVVVFDVWLPLAAAEKIQAYASVANSLTFTITGVETT